MTLDEFYANVNHQFSLIVNKIKTEEYSTDTINVLIETYRNRALDVFIRGLNGDLSRMLIIQKPQTLPEAYASCLEIQNLNFRNFTIHKKNINNSVTAPINQIFSRPNFNSPDFQRNHNQMTLPQRNVAYNSVTAPTNQIFSRPHFNPPDFQKNHNQMTLPQRNMAYNIQHQNIKIPPRPTHPKPPEPMDIDPSLQSRQINYMNRPPQQAQQSQQAFKRENSYYNEPRRQQRVYHIETQEEGDNDEYSQLLSEKADIEELEDEEEIEENAELNFMMGASLAYHT